jgi:hypothetical protein
MATVQAAQNGPSRSARSGITDVATAPRLICGAAALGVLILGWRWENGTWPQPGSHWWYWATSVIVAFLVFWLSVLPIVLWRTMRVLSSINSPAFRLSQPNCWTEVQHIAEAGAVERMWMEDGNYISLSVAVTTVIVCVSPCLEDPTAISVVASFEIQYPIERAQMTRQCRRSDDEKLLERLRRAIGFPKTVADLRRSLAMLGPSFFQRL